MLSLGESLPLFGGESAPNSIASPVGRSTATRPDASTAREAAPRRGAAEGAEKQAVQTGAPAPEDARVTAYKAAAQKMAAAAGGEAATNDPKVAAELARLKSVDAAVRAHEAAHIMVGGTYVRSAASYTYQTGPDGKQYAIGGEVAIDVSPVPGNPQATIQKMATVRAAAMAPSDPSAADRAVAAAATQQEQAARAELSQAQAAQPQADNEPQAGRTEAAEGREAGQSREGETPFGRPEERQVRAGRIPGAEVQAAYAAAAQAQAEPQFLAAA